MNTEKLSVVITTINPPTSCVKRLVAKLPSSSELVVIGDAKGPLGYLEGSRIHFYGLDKQMGLDFPLALLLPTGHYARKNLGYLIAMQRGASVIYETDDDNAPNETWKQRGKTVSATEVGSKGWLNVYSLFTDGVIWPRGLPLTHALTPFLKNHIQQERWIDAPIQQGLANGSPDVDAIWRMLYGSVPFNFDKGGSWCLRPNVWCPFNSQNTWWWPEAFPLMYLPSYCSFRMTDIWRSFIAQRCLWELGAGVVFHAADVVQERNQHSLLTDFKDEVPGNLLNEEIVEILGSLRLKSGRENVCSNLIYCYEALCARGIFPNLELPLVRAWVDSIVS
jgi:hypothetical protein